MSDLEQPSPNKVNTNLAVWFMEKLSPVMELNTYPESFIIIPTTNFILFREYYED
jgi:hypothetical protein